LATWVESAKYMLGHLAGLLEQILHENHSSPAKQLISHRFMWE